MVAEQKNPPHTESVGGGEGSLGITLGIVFTSVFYAAVWAFPHPWMHRYFLGHPVCVAASLLFGIAASILLVKSLRVSSEMRLANSLRDAELSPVTSPKQSASENWVLSHDAGRVAQAWLQSIADLPLAARKSRLVGRLTELLQRQSGRVSTRHLSDDLREVSARESDSAHDSLQLVRIIIWAIPMLGFLGTVVGITQTLGGLDFTDGNAAVDRLKSGLYVAFDTTAVGLVLSVIAIFLQFPVERAEQQLLGEIDRRVGNLLVSKLPPDDAADNPAGQIAQLCDGIRVAVAESLASQTVLWRQTIDEAHLHWQRIAEDNGQRIGDAIMQSLAPALREHATVVSQQTKTVTDQTVLMREHIDALREQSVAQKDQASAQREHILSLQENAQSFAQTQVDAASELDQRLGQWTNVLTDSTRVLTEHQQALIGQLDEFVHSRERTDQMLQLQSALDTNLLRIAEASDAAQRSLDAHASGGISHAMITLATAVDLLADKLPKDNQLSVVVENDETRVRRAA
jgi:biopolymer transport protein ExbB/TolQ